jgi:uncharacterized protein YecE (DUF72 family)
MSDARPGERIRIGTCGYSYPGPPPQGWHGVFYPAARGRKFDELEYYSRFFDVVEINSSFYRPPTPSTAEAWVNKTPPDFLFAVKAWQKFTHASRIGEGAAQAAERWEAATQEDVDLFRRAADPVAKAGKLGLLLFQFPPSFHRTEPNVERLRWTLAGFAGYPRVVELRHRSWSDRSEETRLLLEGLGASWAVIDEPKYESSVKQEFTPAGEILYLRLHGRNRVKWWRHDAAWERYDYLYSADEILEFADQIRRVARASPKARIYVLLNNHSRGQAPANAIMLKHELGLPVKLRPAETLIEAFPQISPMVPPKAQQGLF